MDNKWRHVAAAIFSLAVVLSALAGAPAQEPASLMSLPAVPVQELAARLKESFVKALPDELEFQTANNWGQQTQVPWVHGVRLVHATRNHGDWEKARVVSGPLARDLRVSAADLQSTSAKQIALTLHLAMPATVRLNKQIWQSGIEVYSARVRARFQLRAALTIEAVAPAAAKESSSAEWPTGPDGSGEPSYKVTRATFSCDDFAAENINGLGGDFARLTKPHRGFWPWHSAILGEFEKTILAAMEPAGTAGEVQASLDQLLAQVPAARADALKTIFAARYRPVATATPRAVPVDSAPVPLFSGITIDFPTRNSEQGRTPVPKQPAPPSHAEHYGEWGLAPRSIHYEPPTPAQHGNQAKTFSTPEPAHRR